MYEAKGAVHLSDGSPAAGVKVSASQRDSQRVVPNSRQRQRLYQTKKQETQSGREVPVEARDLETDTSS